MAERDVRFVQLSHTSWGRHGGVPQAINGQCNDTDQPTTALIMDLKQHGLPDDTLMIWGGEFGRTINSQGTLTDDNWLRDRDPRCLRVFLAAGGIKPGMSLGQADDACYSIVLGPVSSYDRHATMLHQLGIDHNRLTFRHQDSTRGSRTWKGRK